MSSDRTGVTQTTKNERPRVHVSALTANTCEVMIFTDEGDVRLICSHGAIEVEAKGLEIRVKP